MSFGTLVDIVAIIYGVFAIGVVVQLWRNRGATFDERFTPQDRRLAGAATFYLAIPVVVGLHELGHAAATWALGGHVAEYHYLFYWGYVVPERDTAFAPGETALIAASGNLVTLAIGFAMILWTVRRPINAAWNFARLELARIALWLTLVIYPAMSLLLRSWDFAIIHQQLNAIEPWLGHLTMGVYGGFAFWVWTRWRGPWRRPYLWLATPLYDRQRAAERRVRTRPEDSEALRELGRVYLSGDEATKALGPLQQAADVAPDEPETRFLAGLAHLRTGEPRAASEHLRAAGGVLEDRGWSAEQEDLYFEVTLGLAAARLALSDSEGAVLTVEAARGKRPSDPRVVLLHADALLAAGRPDEARGRLQGALETARGAFASEIKRRLKALG